ncbi:MAG: type II toxin-antitoxin system Phd/YefM family antitoxin [Thermoleophilia bacterium]|nr:type II toxin-antitoxin system Phd/YefM family antitoxin [Thermoleophilia bacterium]
MPRTIPHRELRNNSSAVLRDVRAGETLTITNHGEIVAVLMPPSDSSLTPSLRIRTAVKHGDFSGLPSVEIDHPIQESLDELRDER